jgi:peptide/nickel transport system substrate-binding protein
MENRFGVKDFVLVALLIVVIVMSILQMVQYDRQWSLMQQSNRMLTEQATDLAKIRRKLDEGVVGTATPSATGSPMAGFERVLAAQQMPDFAPGDSLVHSMAVVPDKLTPLISGDAASAEVQSYVLDSLADRDPVTLAWIPRLALSWKISDDQLTIDFNLRKGVTFSDGSDLTADDVVFTMDLERNEQIEAPRVRAYLDKLDTVTKTGDYGVRFKFKEPYFMSFETAATTAVLSKKFYSQFTPTDFNRSTGYLLGSGPYRLPDPTAWKPEPGKPITLVRNERYWGPTPSFNSLVWKIIENPSAARTAFGNGETDSYGPNPDQYDQMCADPQLVARTSHFAIDRPNSGFGYIGWNEKVGRDGPPSLFADARVRRAMTMLINREEICKRILNGYATVNSGPFSPLTPQADPSIKPWPYDPAAAESLLKEAGFTRKDSQLFGPDGKPFSFELMYRSQSQTQKRIVSLVKDSMAKAGIEVIDKPVEWSVLLGRIDDRDFQAVTLGWTGGIEFDAYQIFDSKQMAGKGDDFIQFADPALDVQIEKARAIVDDSKRMQVWHLVHQILHEDEPYTILEDSKDLEFVSGRLHNVQATKLGLNPELEWFVPKALQKYTN